MTLAMASSRVTSVNGRVKRKHQSISIQEKVEILEKLDNGVSVSKLCDTYGIGSSTVYDIKKHKDKILKFYADSDSKMQMSIRKTMKDGKSTEHDRVMMEWFRQCRSDGVHLTGSMIMDQAKFFHKELELEHKCDYSEGWLQRFKKRHGIILHRAGGRKSTQKGAAEYMDEFATLVSDEHFSPEQIYNTDETALYWRCTPSPTKCLSKDNLEGLKESKNDDAVVGCSNATNAYEYKSQLLERSKYPMALREIKIDPDEDERLIIDKLIVMLGDVIRGLEQCTFVTEQELMHFYLMQEKLYRERSTHTKQLRVDEMFKELAKKNASHCSRTTGTSENLTAQTREIQNETVNSENIGNHHSLRHPDLCD